MNDSRNRNNRLFKGLVVDVVNGLRGAAWSHAEIEAIFSKLPDLPYGGSLDGTLLDEQSFTFTLGWDGSVSVVGGFWDKDHYRPESQVSWAFEPQLTGAGKPSAHVMLIGKLQWAFVDFYKEYNARCSRIWSGHKGGVHHPHLGGGNYFSEVCLHEYLKHPVMSIRIGTGEVVVNDQHFKTSRGWRRDVRMLAGV